MIPMTAAPATPNGVAGRVPNGNHQPNGHPTSGHNRASLDVAVRDQLQQIPISDIVPAPDNPRDSMGKLDELIASVRAVGVLQPLVLVRQTEVGRYMIVCGERRWAAAFEAGLTKLPCIVRDLTETERVEAMLVENLQRSSLSKMEEARAYAQLLKLGYTQNKIARRVGKSQSYICRRLLLLSLPIEVRAKVESGQLPIDHALGYDTTPTADLFVADDQLQKEWLALRHEVLEMADRRLIRLLRDFALAFVRYQELVAMRSRPGVVHRLPGGQAFPVAPPSQRYFSPAIIRAE